MTARFSVVTSCAVSPELMISSGLAPSSKLVCLAPGGVDDDEIRKISFRVQRCEPAGTFSVLLGRKCPVPELSDSPGELHCMTFFWVFAGVVSRAAIRNVARKLRLQVEGSCVQDALRTVGMMPLARDVAAYKLQLMIMAQWGIRR